MNRWLQTKLYECKKCESSYLHDHGYRHELFQCHKRNQPAPGDILAAVNLKLVKGAA